AQATHGHGRERRRQHARAGSEEDPRRSGAVGRSRRRRGGQVGLLAVAAATNVPSRRCLAMTRTIFEPERRTPVLGEPEVLVVGGGAAGIAAACAAARSGVETLLIERFGFLGGTLTAVTLGGFCGTHAIVDDSGLARVVGGLYLDLED